MPNGGWEGQEGSPKKGTPGQDHAAVPRTLRGATNGASGGDSPMSEPSRTAGGGFGTHLRLGGGGPGGYSGQVAVRLSRPAPRWWISSAPGRSSSRAHSSCARQRRGRPSASLRPSTTTTARAAQPCRSPRPVTEGMRRGRGLLGGGVERLL